MSAAAVGFCLSAVWLIPVLVLHFRSLARIDGLLAAQAEKDRAWADALAASRVRSAPSIRRPEPEDEAAKASKLAELRRLAERPAILDTPQDPTRTIIPVDF